VPEGDTIYRTAAALRAALLGRSITGFEVAQVVIGVRPRVGSVIERVDSHGKHLEMGWDDGTVLHTHLRMSGSWHLYRIGEGWRKPLNQARVVVLTDAFEAVCFNAPIIETYRTHDYLWHPFLGRLGPDLADANVSIDECVDRMNLFCESDRTVAETLLDQRVACGVGNVWKSETLWLSGVHPETPIGALVDEQKAFLIRTASDLLRANLDRVDRVTTSEIGGLAVYGRANRRCFRCGDTIEVSQHGEQTRVTYWCGGCQMYLPMDEPPSVVSAAKNRPKWLGTPRQTTSVTGPSYDIGDESELGIEIEISPEISPEIDLYDEPVFAASGASGAPQNQPPADPLLARAAAQRNR
jgi:endonuclease VIII